MGQELIVPPTFSAPAQAFAKLDPQSANLAKGIGQSYGIIGYRGKVWSLRYRGDRKNILRPDDGTPSNYLDVIILGQADGKSKSYFKKYDPNAEGDGPLCSSIDGIIPDPDVPAKQSQTCALCPRNVWKTDPQTGRKGRECTDYKRLAVLILPTQTKPILGAPLMEPVFLRVPPASLNSLAIMGDTMTNRGFHPATYITRISFDANEAHPKMIFTPLQQLTDKEGPIILGLMEDATVNRITGGDVVLPVDQPGQQTVLSPSASTIAPSGPSPLTEKADTASSNSVSALPASTITETTAISPASSTGLTETFTTATVTPNTNIDTGFGGATTVPTQPPSTATLSVADTGPAEASDDDLDARIAGLIKTS